jgi:hypothetical protein
VQGAQVFKNNGRGGGSGADARAAGPGLPQRHTFRLRGVKAAEQSSLEEFDCQATDIVEAIGIAKRHFGAGDVEIRCWRGRDYEVRIHADGSWSLKPLYKL